MIQVCPTITAFSEDDYNRQMAVVSPFARGLHIDLMDGQFAPSRSPDITKIWWQSNQLADLHMMYLRPSDYLDTIIKLKPNRLIFHFEADVDHVSLAKSLQDNNIKAGLALLANTPVTAIKDLIGYFDQILIFSGHLGYHGGQADLKLTDKIAEIKNLSADIEIAWDGGINDLNIKNLLQKGVSVFNVGGYIHNASNPGNAYAKLEVLIKQVSND